MAPEGQQFWEDYGDDVIYLSVMTAGNGAQPTLSKIQTWTTNFSPNITHPIVVDPTTSQIDYVLTGYPTFVVIDRTMTIRNADLWPWNESEVLSYR